MTTPVSTITCPGCQTPHPPELNFCGKCGADLRPAVQASSQDQAADPLLGRTIDARYRVIGRLGQGAMGIVYKVEHQRMGKLAAMKVLHRDLAADKEVMKRFRREAEAVSKLTHPNTVQTFDFGTADGAMYLVMELVRGEDLGAILRRDGPLPYARAAPLFIQICNALAEAHELGIVHRDLKPENILVTRTRDGQDHVKVLDFGLAKLSEREEAAEVTGRGSIVGTPYYMSPEQIRGEELDHRSDIYSLGAMLYRMLTGEHPFTAQSPVGVLTKHLTDPLIPPSERKPELEIDTRVEAIVMRAMAKQREERYASVEGMRADLERVREELRTTPSDPAARTPRSGHPDDTPVPKRRGHEDGSTTALPRLKREDFLAFERRLRRRAVFRMFVVPLVVLALASVGLGYWRWRKRQPKDAEVEPNNDVEHATTIAPGRTVTGKIKERLSDTQSDRDYFRVKLRPSPARLTARVSAIRNIDMALVIYDPSGRVLAVGDNGGLGIAEVVPNLLVEGDDLYLAVMESREGAEGRTPTENLTDQYELSVALTPPADDEELEPDDVDSEARPIEPGRAKKGYLGRIGDVERFRFRGLDGIYDIEVVGLEAETVRIRVRDDMPRSERKVRVRLRGGDHLGVERLDALEKGATRRVANGCDVPYTLTVRPVSGE